MNIFVKDKEFYKNVAAISIPIALQGLINVGVSMTDTMMLGSFGEITLSAASLANQFCFIFLIINFGLGGGAGVLSGQFWGKKDTKSINKVLSILIKASVLFALLFLFLAQAFPETIMSIYTKETAVSNQGMMYLKIVSLSFIFQGISTTVNILFRTVGSVKVALFASISSFFVNVFLNWVLIFGNLGAPELGIQGAAIATLTARIIEFSVIMIYLFKIDKKLNFKFKYLLQLDKELLKNYIRVGGPVLVSDLILAIGLNMVSVIMGRIGSDMVAANSISSVVLQFTNVFLMGVSNASGVITGNTIGQGQHKLAQERAVTFLAMSIILGLSSAFFIFILKNVIIDFYNISNNTKQMAIQLMNSTSFLVVFMSISSLLTKGVLRAGGDTKFLMIADILFLWTVSIPLGAIAGLVFKLPAGIVLICLKIDEIIKGLWCVGRLLSKKWIRSVDEEEQCKLIIEELIMPE
ncbi:MATE family efflux transporter [Clostridium sp. CCUG 7971]|uniref:MATE family efflux transporter n=1 Tax=Clostridium sp. CCUG 7971 TaxID=2811414 RepID=UPI001ABB033F|nr:MATE family efflux transporter [Clostridium sp. CCUG 7971]MBO3445037.1 MATE family efflux transporter [Clostridium sp. CCUG 7971]